MNNVRRKFDTRRASEMPCRVTTPANPNGSSWERSCACDWSEMENTIIESQRIRTTKRTEKTQKDHIADRGHVSMSHYNMVHTPNSIPKAVIIPAVRTCNGQRLGHCGMLINETVLFAGRIQINLLPQLKRYRSHTIQVQKSHQTYDIHRTPQLRFSYPQNIEHQWTSISYYLSKRSMEISSLPESWLFRDTSLDT